MPESIEKSKRQELYLELKQLDEEIKKLNTHLETVDEQVSELNSNKIILNKFSELKSGDELRVPLSSGVYIKAELKDNKKLLVNVGSNVAVEKTPREVIEILDGQLTELISYRENLVLQMKQLIAKIEEIQKHFE